jgi:hypothetical protein
MIRKELATHKHKQMEQTLLSREHEKYSELVSGSIFHVGVNLIKAHNNH